MKTTTKLFIGAIVFTGSAYLYYRYKKPKKSGLNRNQQSQLEDDTTSTVAIDNPSTPRNESAMNQKEITMVDQMRIERDLQMQNLSLGKKGKLIRNL